MFFCRNVQNVDYIIGQIFDLVDKFEQLEVQFCRGGFMLGMDIYEKKSEDKFVKVIKDGYGVCFF